MRRILIMGIVVAFLPISLQQLAAAEVPRTVQGYALELEFECAEGPNPAPLSDTPSSKLIELAAQGSKWKVFIVDGAYTRCGDEAPLCGTGGCPIGVFRVVSGVTTNLYNDQGLGWEISHNGFVLTVHVHGSICGGFGPDPCVTEINLENGKRRTFWSSH
jgi:hypothetical protein